MNIDLNLSENDAINILRLMHVEYVRLLTINYTTQDDDDRADSANDGIAIEMLRKEYEAQLVTKLGQAKLDLAKANFERTYPTPKRP